MSVTVSAVTALLCTLTSCHSPKGPKRDPHEPISWSERISQQRPDNNKASKFDKMLSSSELGDRGAMKVMGRRSYGTSDFKGQKTYTGSKDFKTKDYNGAGKTNRAESQLSRLGSQESKAGNKTFATTDSRWSRKDANGSDKVFHGSDSSYKTAEFEPAKKSIDQNKRPYFLPSGKIDEKKVYDEQTVRGLLNRN